MTSSPWRTISSTPVEHHLLLTILAFFGGRAQPMMQQLVEAGKLTLDDVRDLEKAIRKRARQQDAEVTRKK